MKKKNHNNSVNKNSYLQQGHCIGVLSFLLLALAPGQRMSSVAVGKNLSREEWGSDGKGRQEEVCCSQSETGRDRRLEGWGVLAGA